MIKIIKNICKRIIPNSIWAYMHDARIHSILIDDYNRNASIKRLRNSNDTLNVLFLLFEASNWKYDSLYQLMSQDARFNPIIVVCPEENRSEEHKLERLRLTCQYFKKKGYNYICGYNSSSNSYVDVRKYNPDIIFYSSPYSYLIDDRFYISSFKDILTCYVNYFYVSYTDKWTCAEELHKAVWRYYVESDVLAKQVRKYSPVNSRNCRVVGYPLFDSFKLHKRNPKDWPLRMDERKKLIWAPHHSTSSDDNFYAISTFLQYSDFIWNLTQKFIDKIQVVFKPHPLLKQHLYIVEGWGKERTDAYYDKWANGENTAFVDGEYVGLFWASDAMIHDCNSFTVEYLAVNKPAMFLETGSMDERQNKVGVEAKACYYKGYCEEDIENFIKMIIEGGKDELKERREAFYKNYILPPNGKLAAENIIDDLLTSLGRK